MEEIGFGRFGIHAMSHRAGVLDWPAKLPPLAKYVFQYLFVQAEFGLLCPINMLGSSSELVRRYGSQEVRDRYLDSMLTQDLGQLRRSAQFMTEKAGGSDVGAADLTAVRDGAHWRLLGRKVVLLQCRRRPGRALGEAGRCAGRRARTWAVPHAQDTGRRHA
jgi:alkylation response protein AidB-like acyl-CoA dehydrogenase